MEPNGWGEFMFSKEIDFMVNIISFLKYCKKELDKNPDILTHLRIDIDRKIKEIQIMKGEKLKGGKE